MSLPGMYISEFNKQLYYEKGYWTTRTIYDYFTENVARFPENTAVVDRKEKVNYRRLSEWVNQAERGLNHFRVKKGDFVAAQLPNWVEHFVIYLAAAKIGAIYNPIPTTARHRELSYMLSLCEPKVLFIPHEYRNFNHVSMLEEIRNRLSAPPEVIVIDKDDSPVQEHSFVSYRDFLRFDASQPETMAQVNADDPTVVLFTSGTESNPKAVIHTHNTLISGQTFTAGMFHLTEKDAVLMGSPLTHATGFMNGLILPILIGAKSVILERFTPQAALEKITMEHCTFSSASTPFLYDTLQELAANKGCYDISHFRFFICAGAPIPRHIVAQAYEHGFKVVALYGSSESPFTTVNRLDDPLDYIINCDGRTVEGIDVKIVDDLRKELPFGEAGEAASRGPQVFVGYYKQPKITAAYLDRDGWYYSGDLCTLQGNGFLRVVGRKKDMIIRGGQNISPREIEDLLSQHPNLEKVAIIGEPDERLGERACAFVVTKEGSTLTFEEMISFLTEKQIAKYKFPESLQIVREMPMTPSGKIQKYVLKAMLHTNKKGDER